MTELGQFAGEVSAPPIQPIQPPAKPGRGWMAMLGVIAALFVVLTLATTAVVALGGKTSGQAVNADTPQGAVQSWATAMEAGNYVTADTYLSTRLKSSGTTSSGITSGQRVTDVIVSNPQVGGDAVSVSVAIHATQGDGSLTLISNFLLQMIRENGGWKIDILVYIYPAL
jgi:hypothetical protein